MPDKQVDEFVAENRENLRRIDSELVEVSNRRDTNLTFIRNSIEVTIAIQIYKRSLGNNLISGHPNGSVHGSAHGESGDNRGSWNLVTDTEVSEEFTTFGRNSVRNALSGESTGRIDKNVIGDGTNTATSSDSALQNQTSQSDSWTVKPNGNQVKSRAIFLFSQHNENVSEFGVLSNSGNLLARITTDPINPTLEEEIRVDVDFSFSGDGTGTSVITDIGEEVVADSVRQQGTLTGIDEVVFGSGSSEPAESDTALDNEIIGKAATRELEPEEVVAHAYLFDNEPATQPVTITEIGVTDNNDRLLWRTLLREFEKTDQFKIESFVGFRII